MILLWLAACPRSILPELELDRSAGAAVAAEPAELEPWREWLLHGDLLARRPRTPATLLDPGLAVWKETAGGVGESASFWRAELSAPRTASLPLVRGARLAAVESLPGDAAGRLAWVVPLAEPGGAPLEGARAPMEWLGADTDEALFATMERSVLLGWLDAPGIAWPSVLARLSAPDLARLAETPVGAILLARRAPDAPPSAGASLRSATELALLQAAADLPREHEAARKLAAQLAPDQLDPAASLLRSALPALTAGAGNDATAGLALVAHTALRWREACTDRPCGGFDRLPTLAAAAGYGPEAAELAAVWRVVAWKSSVDELHAGWGRPQVVPAMDRIVELVASEQPRALDRNVLLRPQPDPAWSLAVSRAVGGPEGTDRKVVERALYRRVGAAAEAARAAAPAFAEPLERIVRRSAKYGE